LPSLAERPLKERMELIQNILTTEAARAKRTLTIPAELLRCLLLYDCLSYNIIQLKADLRRGCAMAYLRERGSGDENLNLYISDFEHHIRKGFLNYEKHRKETEEIIPLDYHYTFSASAMEMSTKSRRQYRGFYDEIDKKAGELMERGINADEINLFLSTELEATYRQFWNESVSQQINKEQLINLVNKDVIEPVEAFLNDASAKLSRDFSPSVFYGLCLHIDNAIKGNVSKQLMSVPQMSAIVEKYKLEYSLSLLFITGIEKIFSIKLPIDETVLITLFLLSDDPRVGTVKRPVILFALHGNGVAASLANMINSIANFDNTFFCEIPFAQEHTKTYENLQKHIKNIDRGKGVAVIYDMDFLAPMLNTAAGEIGIEIRTIKLPITLSGIEWSRRAAIVSDVDTLSQSINTTINGYKKSPKKIIVTLCTTGEGGALQLKKYIMKYGDMKDIDIVPLAMANGELLRNKLTELQDEYLIYCIVGTFDPMLFGIPYIPVSDVLGVSPKMLPEILRFKKQEKSRIDLDEVFAYLKEQLLNIDVKKLRNLLPPIIEEFNEKITPMSIDTEVGLLIHMACSINRLAGNLSLPVNIRKEAIIKAYDTHYKQIRKLVKPLEKAFKTIITDDELANIIMIVNKL
ncbi:MAG: PRD domain-containing protein, partial [Lachnospiraceae bacterium]|nr:PRD domain-containing protein [Lachnospiraceae bacterium]